MYVLAALIGLAVLSQSALSGYRGLRVESVDDPTQEPTASPSENTVLLESVDAPSQELTAAPSLLESNVLNERPTQEPTAAPSSAKRGVLVVEDVLASFYDR